MELIIGNVAVALLTAFCGYVFAWIFKPTGDIADDDSDDIFFG